MPWVPEVFSAPVQERLKRERRREQLVAVPYFEGVMAGETNALIDSFAGEPQLHHPIRGRIRDGRAFETYVNDTIAWLTERNATVEEIGHVITPRQGFEEVVLHLDGESGRIELPVAIVAEYHRALAAGDLDAIVSTFEPDGYAREPAGRRYLHRGPEALRSFYGRMFSNDGGISLQHCGVIDHEGSCALEYNVVRWGRTDLPPQAGVAIYVRGESGKLAAARIYDDADPAIGPPT